MSRDSIIVSVVVTCYNQSKFIKESINSILKQTYSNWECIIVDDGSVDNTGMIVNDYLSDIRIKYIYQQNSGVSAARNAGIAQSSGEYVQFLDGDDILEERKFELQVSFLEQNPIVDIVYGSTRYFYDGVFKKKYLLDSNGMIPTIEIHQYDQDQPWALVYRNLTTICAPLYRRSIFTAGHTFKNIIFEDWYFHLETALKGKIFHFERMAGATCFVRLSNDSQMQRHKKVAEKSPDVFPLAIDGLIKQYNYSAPFERPAIIEKIAWKEGVKLFLPPIIMKMFRFFKGEK